MGLIETFSFDKGVNQKKGRLFLGEGEVYDLQGGEPKHDGQIECRDIRFVNADIDATGFTAGTSTPNAIHRYDNDMYAAGRTLCYGGEVYFNYLYHRFVTATDENNLLQNPSFKMGLAGWTNWSDTNAKCEILDETLFLGDDDGSELVTNGTFNSNIASWTDLSTGTGVIDWNAGTLELHTGTGTGWAEQSIITSPVVEYTLTFDKSGGGKLYCWVGSSSGSHDLLEEDALFGIGLGDGTHTFTFTATGATSYIQFLSLLGHPHIDNVSCKDKDTVDTGWVEQKITVVNGVVYTVTIDLSGSTLDYLNVGTTSKGLGLLNQAEVTVGVHSYNFTASGTDAYINFKSTEGDPWSRINSISVTSASASILYAEKFRMNGNARPRFIDYEKFTFYADGKTRKAFVEDKIYDWGVPNPTSAPVVVDSGNAGTPNGTYNCYYTWYVIYPNDKVVETGLSPADSVTVVTNKINWNHVPICPYGGAEVEHLTIHRKLYREVSGVVYLVDTITNNTATSYLAENLADATLQTNSACETEDYGPPPEDITDIAQYLQRMFYIKDNKLGWSEPYKPLSFLSTSNIAVTKDNEPLVCVINWGDQLWVASRDEWYRLSGTDPDTWAIKRTFTDNGVINNATVDKTKYGILGLWHDGIYLFDGSVSTNLTEKKLGRSFFTDMDDLSVSNGCFNNYQYILNYASTGSTIDNGMVLDFAYYPDYRIYFKTYNGKSHATYFYKPENIYYQYASGYETVPGYNATAVTDFSLITGDKGFQAIVKRKCLRYLYYDVYTNDKDLLVDILVDGTSVQQIMINNSARERNRSMPLMAKEGYRFALKITAASFYGMIIYAPWVLEADPVGD